MPIGILVIRYIYIYIYDFSKLIRIYVCDYDKVRCEYMYWVDFDADVRDYGKGHDFPKTYLAKHFPVDFT